MDTKKTSSNNKAAQQKKFDKLASSVTRATGSSYAVIVAAVFVLIWAVSGPLFRFSDTWQLIINTVTSIVTFLMVFIIQQSQNKDTMALQLKLNELIAASSKASNRLIDVEDLSDDELRQLKKFYCDLGELAEKDNTLFASHSVEEAKDINKEEQDQLKSD